MKSNLLLVAVGVLLVITLIAAKPHGNYNLTAFNSDFDPANVQRLNKVYQALLNYGGLTDQQIGFMLSQILVETGLFTDSPNLKNVDQLNNYAGISSGSGYKSYPSVADFVSDYVNLLNNGYDALNATSISDFNTRLNNGTYGRYYESNPVTYGNNLSYYYNLLTTVLQ